MCLRLMRDTIILCSFQVNMVMWLILEGSYRHRCSTLPRASERDVQHNKLLLIKISVVLQMLNELQKETYIL